MTFNSNEIHHRVPPVSSDVDSTFEDEFDQLLEQSSLGTPNARAIQAMTSPDLVERVQNCIDQEPGGVGSARDEGDVDDLLLDLVRCATVPDERDPRRREVCPAARWSVLSRFSFLAQGAESWSTVVAMVAWLAEANVFEHVRRDVARSVLDLAFRNEHAPHAVQFLLLHSTLARSGVIEELTCRRPLPALTDWVGGLELREPPRLRGKTCPAAEGAARDQGDELEPPVRYYSNEIRARIGTGSLDARLVGPHHMLDDLVVTIERFAVRWYSDTSGAWAQWGRPCGSETSVVTPLSGALLGLMHEGSQTSSVLVSAVHQRFKLPDVTHASVCCALRTLREGGLIQPTSRARTMRRYELTTLGIKAFRRWLLVEPGTDRGEVVLRLLSTTSFTAEQQSKLIVLSKALKIDEEQARALTKWMTENLAPISTTCRHILTNLISKGRR
ncbi:hypothetical protein LFM09_43730 [Lentzea alba]|uniref:hypothetical protein n=1 Tax=Lentzea alba TaxID=2714351 RepID=UPI0039BF5C42